MDLELLGGQGSDTSTSSVTLSGWAAITRTSDESLPASAAAWRKPPRRSKAKPGHAAAGLARVGKEAA